MKTLNHNINGVKIEKEFVLLTTIILTIAGLPLLKNAFVFVLEKLYEAFIQNFTEK